MGQVAHQVHCSGGFMHVMHLSPARPGGTGAAPQPPPPLRSRTILAAIGAPVITRKTRVRWWTIT